MFLFVTLTFMPRRISSHHLILLTYYFYYAVNSDDGNIDRFGLVYFFIHSVIHLTLDKSLKVYNLYITTQLIIYGHPPNII